MTLMAHRKKAYWFFLANDYTDKIHEVVSRDGYPNLIVRDPLQ